MKTIVSSKLSILLLGFWLFFSTFLYAQENRQIDRNEWDKIRKSVRYGTEKKGGSKGEKWTYSQEEWNRTKKDGEKTERRVKRSKSSRRSSPSSSSNSDPDFSLINSSWATILYILVAVVLLGLIAYLIIKHYSKNQKVKTSSFEEQLDKSPQEISLTELQKMLQKALSEENYKEAIRIYFIFVIKELSERKWIQWQKEKTNLAYLREMRKNQHFDLFKTSVNIFDVVWYGNYEIDKTTFQKFEPVFKKLHKKLNIQ